MKQNLSILFSFACQPENMKALIAIDIAPVKSPSKDAFLKYSQAMKELSFPKDTSLAEAKSQAKSELAKSVPVSCPSGNNC